MPLQRGWTLGAVVHVPELRKDGARSPAVVMAHGLANDRDEAGQFPPLAERPVAEGNVVMRFDFRGAVRDVDPSDASLGVAPRPARRNRVRTQS